MTITHPPQGADDNRGAIEQLVLASLTRLMGLAGDEVEAEVLRTLQQLGTFFGDDRAYVVLFSNDGSVLETVCEWCAPGVESVLHRLEGRTLESLPWFTARIRALETVQFRDIADLPEAARLEMDEMHAEGVRSLLLAPLALRGAPVGLLMFARLAQPAIWLAEQIPVLMLAGEMLVTALQRKRAEDALREAYQGLEQQVEARSREVERRSRVGAALTDILRVLNSNRALPEVLEYLVAQACRLLKASATMIRRADLETSLVTTEASHALPPEFTAVQRARLTSSVSDRILMSRRPVVISDLQATYTPMLATRRDLDATQLAYLNLVLEHFHSMLSVPLFIKDEIFGSLMFYFSEPRDFPEDDIQLAISLGDQAALAIENARLRSQSEQNAVTMERNRLARDLHDAVTQTLFSASLIAEVLPRLWERNPQEGRRRLEELRQLSRGALAEMRTLLLELRPSALTEARLSELLRQLGEAVSGRARLPVQIQVEGSEFQLEPDVQMALYRIAQEGLNNIVNHAGATQALIQVSFTEGEARALEMRISDNGRGFDPARIPANHLGVGIMRERAQSVSARLEITSSEQQGTVIQVMWEGE